MSDDENSSNDNGERTVTIDTGFYNVTVDGTADDPLEAVLEGAERAAEIAKEDVKELDDDEDDSHFQ